MTQEFIIGPRPNRNSKGKLEKLNGVTVKVLLLWLNIVEVRRNDGELRFSIGIAWPKSVISRSVHSVGVPWIVVMGIMAKEGRRLEVVVISNFGVNPRSNRKYAIIEKGLPEHQKLHKIQAEVERILSEVEASKMALRWSLHAQKAGSSRGTNIYKTTAKMYIKHKELLFPIVILVPTLQCFSTLVFQATVFGSACLGNTGRTRINGLLNPAGCDNLASPSC
ncbi:hypothetical protein RJ639_044019 [Escallonia herrerae]|uniref:Uncharacterized protein n=1 Tax=Escallonia herrerae TaxID=1293975 RepID=A0AA88WC26_9ASTE|nr:hypothetical protein RJ639_044019 [Escallonia herrerae]